MRSQPAPPARPAGAPAAGDAGLAGALRLVVTRLGRRLRKQAGLDLSPTQLSALSAIEARGPMTLGALAAHENVSPPTITVAVGRLEERGLVARATDPDDGRVTRVRVTADGRRLLERQRRRKSAYLERRLRELDPSDRDALARALPVLERLVEES